jgi:hypothetical protein
MFWEIYQKKAELIKHPIYSEIQTLDELRLFMESHVFAVWDFMSLAKRLQRDLTCVALPWLPPSNAKNARLINDIILSEESDIDADGVPASHLEMYIDAMKDMFADTSSFRRFSKHLNISGDVRNSLLSAGVKGHVQNFVNFNIDMAINGHIEEVASSFLFGREDAIPNMFTSLIEQWNIDEKDAPKLMYYLQRHIELDGDEHGHAALELLEDMVKHNFSAQRRAVAAGIAAIEQRITLWDGILEEIYVRREQQHFSQTAIA